MAKVRIVSIGKKDAFYSVRKNIVGTIGEGDFGITTNKRKYVSGTYSTPEYADNQQLVFYEVKVEYLSE